MTKKTSAKTADALKKKVLIVDDHPVFRAGLAALVNLEPDLTVCGEADDAAQAMSAVERLQPEIALMDMSLPDKSGLELLKDIRAIRPELHVLIISMHDEALYAERVLRAGGRGYIMKQAGPDKVIQAIRKVLCGGVSVSDRVSAQILDTLSNSRSRVAVSTAKLTDREFEVLTLIGQGREPRDIAQYLHLSIKTVDTHRAQIKAKLGLKNSTELIHYATRWVSEQS